MKKLFVSFLLTALLTTVSFANTPASKKEGKEKKEIKKEKQNLQKNKIVKSKVCTVECSFVFADGTTITATGGNWFSSCERAARRCTERLADKIEELE